MQTPGDYHYQRALVAFDLSNWSKASKELKDQLALTPDNATALALLAACSINLNKPDESLKQAQAAIAINPRNAYAYYVLSFAQASKRQIFEAEIAIEEALKLEPQSVSYLVAYADLKPKHNSDAIKLLKQALAIDPSSASALVRLHERLLTAGRESEASEISKIMLALYPNDARIQTASGWQALHAPGKQEQALEHFQQAVRLSPNTSGSVEGLIRARYQRNNWLSHLLKHYTWLRALMLAIASTILSTVYFGVCEFILHIPASITLICIAVAAPILLMVAATILDLLNSAWFYLALLFNKKDLVSIAPDYKKHIMGGAVGLGLAALMIWFKEAHKANPHSLPAIPHWLFDDWQDSTPMFAFFMPILFFIAVAAFGSSLFYIARKHIKGLKLNTTYFLSILGLVWSFNLLSWYAVKAFIGPCEPFTYIELAMMLVILIVPQTKFCRDYIKAAIKRDHEKK